MTRLRRVLQEQGEGVAANNSVLIENVALVYSGCSVQRRGFFASAGAFC
jgi:hypothetical protein